jgi:CubicO group peptidase (beta-lactamase class C family)
MSQFWDLSIERHPRDTLVRIVEQEGFLFEPGDALIYNNSAYFFLGLIIEKASGRSYDAYLDEVIFEPLGMKNTYYSSNSEVIPGKVYGYSYSRDGLKQKPYLDHTWPYSAGSLSSTTEDLLTWMRALHQGDIFNDQLYELLITPGQLNDGTRVRYAMGLVNYTISGNQVIAHGGGIHGFLSETRYYPDEDLYLICLVNTTGPGGADYFVDQLTWEFLEKKEQETVDIDIDLDAVSGKYTGQVRGARLSIEVESQSHELIISRNGRHGTDTLRTYVGNSTWIEGNTIFTTLPDKYRIDDIYGNYELLKE